MEAQLGAELSSINLLRAEVAREEHILRKKTKRLGELRKNAKAAENQRKRQRRASHPVLRELENQGTGREMQDAAGVGDMAYVKMSDDATNEGLCNVSDTVRGVLRNSVAWLTARADGTGRGHAGSGRPAAEACRGDATECRPGWRAERGCCPEQSRDGIVAKRWRRMTIYVSVKERKGDISEVFVCISSGAWVIDQSPLFHILYPPRTAA